MFFEFNIGSTISFAAGAVGTYLAFYFRGALARREQIAKSLAAFYSSAANVYYAYKEYLKDSPADNNNMLYKLFDEHYGEFLSASTMLASLVPPALREEVLKVEDVWDEINEHGFEAVSGKMWFDLLDSVRYKILDSIAYHRVSDPFWRIGKNP